MNSRRLSRRPAVNRNGREGEEEDISPIKYSPGITLNTS